VSAYGKTYLKYLLQQNANAGGVTMTYSLEDHVKRVDIERLVNDAGTKVLLVDRFDMFPDDAAVRKAMDIVKERGIVLVDAKGSHPRLGRYRSAFIRRTPEVIEVYS
jgi:hypothetical protein